MAHGDPRPARTPLSREQRSSFFRVFLRSSSTTCYLRFTVFCRVSGVVYPSWGTTPRNFHISCTGVEPGLQPVRYLGKTGRALPFVGLWRLVRFLFFHCIASRFVALTALHAADAFVCTHDYRVVRTLQATQPLQSVAAS